MCEYPELSSYREISVFRETPEKKIRLVLDEISNELCVEKILYHTEDIDFYVRLTKIKHKNIAKTIHVHCIDQTVHIYQEYILGQTLDALMEQDSIKLKEHAIDYTIQICDALICLHNQDPPIIYRDIKPENIIVSADGVVKLVDFDIAREYKQTSSRDTMFVGTKEYAAPEQYGYQQTDCRTDIYSVGVLLHEMLTGQLPQNNIVCKGFLKKIIEKCLRMEPQNRYQSVNRLKNALTLSTFSWHKRKMIYILPSLFMICIIFLFSSIANWTNQTNPPNMSNSNASEPATSESATIDDIIQIQSEDGLFHASLPNGWSQVKDHSLSDYAVLQAQNKSDVAYFTMFAYRKSETSMSFEEWKESLLFELEENMESVVIVTEIKTELNHYPVVHLILEAKQDGVPYKYLMTYIDGENYYGDVRCWSEQAKYLEHISSFHDIVESITGLSDIVPESSNELPTETMSALSEQTLDVPELDIRIQSADSLFSVDLPTGWVQDNSYHELAALQAFNESESLFFLMNAENKNIVAYSFEQWKEYVFTGYLESYDEVVISPERRFELNGRTVLQHTVECVLDGVKGKMLMTYVDGETYYGQVLFWGYPEALDKHPVEFYHAIIKTINGLSSNNYNNTEHITQLAKSDMTIIPLSKERSTETPEVLPVPSKPTPNDTDMEIRIQSSDGLFQVEFPRGWVQEIPMSEFIVIQAVKDSEWLSFYMTAQNKSEITESFEELNEFYLSGYFELFADAEISPVEKITLNNYLAHQYTFKGKLLGFPYTYDIAFIDGKNYHSQVIFGGYSYKYDAIASDVFSSILETIKGL